MCDPAGGPKGFGSQPSGLALHFKDRGLELSMEGPKRGETLWLAHPFVVGTRWIMAYPVTTIAVCLAVALGACYLTATRLGYQTSRLDLLNPKSNYNRLWLEYIKEFGDEDDAVVVVEGQGREQVVPVLEELS